MSTTSPRRPLAWLLLALALPAGGGALVALIPSQAFAVLRHLQPPERWLVPVDGVRASDLVSTFGAPRSGGRRRHEGVDIFAKRGTPVVAAVDGTVWKVGHNRLGGRVVGVIGDGPAYYYYAHLESWAEGLRPGDRVSAGDVLGYVGNSGNARTTPPHLHFGVYPIGLRGRSVVDPVPLLAASVDSLPGSS